MTTTNPPKKHEGDKQRMWKYHVLFIACINICTPKLQKSKILSHVNANIKQFVKQILFLSLLIRNLNFPSSQSCRIKYKYFPFLLLFQVKSHTTSLSPCFFSIKHLTISKLLRLANFPMHRFFCKICNFPRSLGIFLIVIISLHFIILIFVISLFKFFYS